MATEVLDPPPVDPTKPLDAANWLAWDVGIRVATYERARADRAKDEAVRDRALVATESNATAMTKMANGPAALIAALAAPGPAPTDAAIVLSFMCSLLEGGYAAPDAATKAKTQLAAYRVFYPKSTPAPK